MVVAKTVGWWYFHLLDCLGWLMILLDDISMFGWFSLTRISPRQEKTWCELLRVHFYNAVCMAEMLPTRLTSLDFERKLMTRLQEYNRYQNFVQHLEGGKQTGKWWKMNIHIIYTCIRTAKTKSRSYLTWYRLTFRAGNLFRLGSTRLGHWRCGVTFWCQKMSIDKLTMPEEWAAEIGSNASFEHRLWCIASCHDREQFVAV